MFLGSKPKTEFFDPKVAEKKLCAAELDLDKHMIAMHTLRADCEGWTDKHLKNQKNNATMGNTNKIMARIEDISAVGICCFCFN